MKLENKVALITGASRGIGKAIAEMFAREGANVVINYANNQAAAEKVAGDILNISSGISSTPRRVLLVRADISKTGDRFGLVEKTLTEFGRIDILVNNAGILLRTDLDSTTEASWDSTMDINLKSMFFLSRLVADQMIPKCFGKIINIASQSGVAAPRSNIEYGLSKAGVIHLTRVFAKILAPCNINVNCISPGRVSTDMTNYDKDTEKKARREKEIPLGRIATPEDVAHLAVFLASEDSRNITGKIIAVDGGSVI